MLEVNLAGVVNIPNYPTSNIFHAMNPSVTCNSLNGTERF